MPEIVQFCIGYVGMTPYYHTIYIIDQPVPITKATVMQRYQRIYPQVLMLSPRRKFHKPHIKRKHSTNYEGLGKNKK